MLELEKLNYDNVDGVALLEKECFGDDAWSKTLFLQEILQENKHYVVVKKDENVIAYGGVAQVLDEGHIMNIAVQESYRNQGIASYVIDKILSTASEKNITRLTLEVRESNIPARNLYEKHSFKLEGIRKGYYQDKENACIYWRVL